MSVLCPVCKETLYLKVEVTQTFSIKEIGMTDVIIEDMVDQDKMFHLFCLKCNFQGWVDEYYDEIAGIHKLFNRKGKLKCTCSSK